MMPMMMMQIHILINKKYACIDKIPVIVIVTKKHIDHKTNLYLFTVVVLFHNSRIDLLNVHIIKTTDAEKKNKTKRY